MNITNVILSGVLFLLTPQAKTHNTYINVGVEIRFGQSHPEFSEGRFSLNTYTDVIQCPDANKIANPTDEVLESLVIPQTDFAIAYCADSVR